MANIYVRSTDGLDADNGSTWALAKATLNGAAGIDAAGDTIWVSQVHNETTAAGVTCAWAGTRASPTKVLCGNDGAEPPTALTTGGKMATTGASGIAWNGFVYTYGVTFSVGSGNSLANFTAANTSDWQRFENCTFLIVATQGSNAIAQGAGSKIVYLNCSFRFSSAGQGFNANGVLHINGGSILSGGTNITGGVIKGIASGSTVLVENFDMSAMGTTFNLTVNPGPNGSVSFRNCKLPASWAGSVFNAGMTTPGRASMYNCDSGNTNYRLWIEDWSGSIKSETTLVKTGGATDGTTHISWKMATSSNCNFVFPLFTDQIAVWVDVGSPASSVTLTIDILRDSATNLKDNEVWVDASYLSSPTSMLGSVASDCISTPITAAADQTASSSSWTTTGMANPNKQQLSVTVTPERSGYIYCRVLVAKPSTTLYVDPQVTVT